MDVDHVGEFAEGGVLAHQDADLLNDVCSMSTIGTLKQNQCRIYANCLVVSDFLSTFADENRIWEMANGHSQVYGNGIIVINNICGNE